jgi:hypothetical protein
MNTSDRLKSWRFIKSCIMKANLHMSTSENLEETRCVPPTTMTLLYSGVSLGSGTAMLQPKGSSLILSVSIALCLY